MNPKTRICLECKIEKSRRKMFRFGDFPEEDGFIWCSDKCILLWCSKHGVTCNDEPITALEKRSNDSH